MPRQLTAFVTLTFLVTCSASADDSQAIFNSRILPIFRSTEPSSCVQCHLSSVDLKNYILPSSTKTFLSLRDQGLIDLKDPTASKILKLIRMGQRDQDEGARLIHEEMRQQEYAAFRDWILACCADAELRTLPPLTETEVAGPAVDEEVIRFTRKSRVIESFARNVWSQRMRCFPCHTPDEIDPDDPKQAAARKTRMKLQEQYGAEMERLDLFRGTPEETFDYLVSVSKAPPSGSLPLLNLEQPTNSLLVLKPTSKLPQKNEDGTFEPPSSIEPVTHMGGLKMHLNDQSYKSFVTWIQDYARTVQGTYRTVDELPEDHWHPTQYIVKLVEAPEDWGVGTVVQLQFLEWDAESQQWNPTSKAFTQGTVTPRRIVNGPLFLVGATAEEAEQVASEGIAEWGGKSMLVRVFVDSGQKLASDPTLILGKEDFVGEIELDTRRWREGFRFGKTVSAAQLSMPTSLTRSSPK